MRIYFYINPVEDEVQGIAVGVCAEDEKGKELLEKLESVEGIFRFQDYQNEEEMIRQIENGTLECGYVFPEGFYENILRGRTVRQITLYCSPASSAHKISYEVVFSELFEILSPIKPSNNSILLLVVNFFSYSIILIIPPFFFIFIIYT